MLPLLIDKSITIKGENEDAVFSVSAPIQLEMERNIRGVAVKGINIGFLRDLQIPVCERAVQDHLATIYKQTDKSKFELKQNIENINALMRSLMRQDYSN